MLDRNFKQSATPSKTQMLSIEYKGKMFAICSEEQMAYLLMVEKDRIRFDDADKVYRKLKKPMTDEELKQALQKYADGCGYGTLSGVLSMMTPAEKAEWEMKYRFAPVMKCKQ